LLLSRNYNLKSLLTQLYVFLFSHPDLVHLPSVDADVQTAQVAAQQGKYLAKMYGTLAKRIDTLDANEMPDHDDEMYYKPFKYLHLGTLAYIGNSYV
jgi:NADH dehydrogenase FAD-containing subunit